MWSVDPGWKQFAEGYLLTSWAGLLSRALQRRLQDSPTNPEGKFNSPNAWEAGLASRRGASLPGRQLERALPRAESILLFIELLRGGLSRASVYPLVNGVE